LYQVQRCKEIYFGFFLYTHHGNLYTKYSGPVDVHWNVRRKCADSESVITG
jgi:hypothetical protein